MGSPATEPCRNPNEDLHAVNLTRAFFYGLKSLRGAYRWSFKETNASTDIGLRCARTRCARRRVSAR